MPRYTLRDPDGAPIHGTTDLPIGTIAAVAFIRYRGGPWQQVGTDPLSNDQANDFATALRQLTAAGFDAPEGLMKLARIGPDAD